VAHIHTMLVSWTHIQYPHILDPGFHPDLSYLSAPIL
jgi:hypothetical protein